MSLTQRDLDAIARAQRSCWEEIDENWAETDEGTLLVLVIVALEEILAQLEQLIEALLFNGWRRLLEGRFRCIEGRAEFAAGIHLIRVVGHGVSLDDRQRGYCHTVILTATQGKHDACQQRTRI